MSKFKLIQGIDPEVEKRELAVKTLQNEVDSKSWLTYKERVVYAYHFMSLNAEEHASKLLNSIPSLYWQGGIFMDLYRSVLAELMYKIEKHDFDRDFEYFVIVKRMIVMMKEIENLSHRWEIYKFSENFKTLSDFTSPPKG